jgi:hypothetical protein
MKFIDKDRSFEISELFDNGEVGVHLNNGHNGVVVLNGKSLIELRNWINRQLLKIEKQKKSKIKTPSI